MARRTPFTLVVAATVVAALGLLVPQALARPEGAARFSFPPAAPGPSASPSSSETFSGGTGGGRAVTVNVGFTGEFFGWALRDRASGTVTGANTGQTSSTESMIKTWLVADFLRTHDDPGDDDLRRASEAIRWSDDDAAQTIYETMGGDASIQRLIGMCALEDTTVHSGWWSRTQMSPRDALKLAECLADGTAAGPQWTPWLLGEMRHVEGTADPGDQQATRGGGRWGIIDGVPAEVAPLVALKNGWTDISADGNWHLNCLAFTDEWSLSVMLRYPSDQGLSYGAGICRDVARQLLS